MEQIDIMVNNKKLDWERKMRALETRLDLRDQELANAQTCLEQAKSALSTRYLSYMQARFRQYWGRLMHLTKEETEALSLDASFAVQTEVLGARRESGYSIP